MLYVGRVAVEKNLEAFLASTVPGSKVVVGDGPDLVRLREAFPEATFLGALAGERLARAYCSAQVFVFPSRTDTFGLVMIEALACGLPVAAFPCRVRSTSWEWTATAPAATFPCGWARCATIWTTPSPTPCAAIGWVPLSMAQLQLGPGHRPVPDGTDRAHQQPVPAFA
jgi:hypothetical protein